MNRADYPDNWEEVSRYIRFDRAGGRCECVGECGERQDHGKGKRGCIEVNGQPAKSAKGTVVLTAAHLNAKDGPCKCDPLCADPDHLKAMCQRCHFRYDLDRHLESAMRKRSRRRGCR